jgi:hypothetical protein
MGGMQSFSMLKHDVYVVIAATEINLVKQCFSTSGTQPNSGI